MATIIQHSELVNRALIFICEKRIEKPGALVAELLDEAGMRFNLGPADSAALERLLFEKIGKIADRESKCEQRDNFCE